MVRRVLTSHPNHRVRTAPVRTCVGCRQRAVDTDLLRVVAVVGEGGRQIVPDPRRRHPGRGAWLHRDPGCLHLAQRRKIFPKALRVAAPVEVTPVREYLAAYGRGGEAQYHGNGRGT